jgi:hypothetical protein
MSDLARLKIWDDPAIRDGLSWYLAVAENKRPAKFRIAATLPTQLDPATSSEDARWAELDRLMPIFLARWQAIRAGASLPPTAHGPSLLEVCRELAYRMLTHCNFCPWNCRVNRAAGTKLAHQTILMAGRHCQTGARVSGRDRLSRASGRLQPSNHEPCATSASGANSTHPSPSARPFRLRFNGLAQSELRRIFCGDSVESPDCTMAVRNLATVQRLQGSPTAVESRPGRIGLISLGAKQTGEPGRCP